MPERLYRSRRERMIGGVAGGIAESLRIDPTIVRVVWVILAFATNGLAIVGYFALLFLLPEAPDEPVAPVAPAVDSGGSSTMAAASSSPSRSSSRAPGPSTDGRTGALLAGALLVLVGGYFLVRQYLPSIDVGLSWPFVAVGVGALLIVAALVRGGRSG